MLDFARTQAAAEHMEDRIEFHMMDARWRMLEFPRDSLIWSISAPGAVTCGPGTGPACCKSTRVTGRTA